jgi:glutamate/aspartate transport system substrate-binding protein
MKGIITAILFFSFFITSLSAQELTGTLQQIKTSGKIKVGYRELYPPLSFLNKNGIPAGYSIDLCKEIVSGIQKK